MTCPWQIVVHGLPFSYESPQLRDLVKQCGQILDCEVKKDRMTGRSKGWGTVLFQAPEGANAAIEVRNGVPCTTCLLSRGICCSCVLHGQSECTT